VSQRRDGIVHACTCTGVVSRPRAVRALSLIAASRVSPAAAMTSLDVRRLSQDKRRGTDSDTRFWIPSMPRRITTGAVPTKRRGTRPRRKPTSPGRRSSATRGSRSASLQTPRAHPLPSQWANTKPRSESGVSSRGYRLLSQRRCMRSGDAPHRKLAGGSSMTCPPYQRINRVGNRRSSAIPVPALLSSHLACQNLVPAASGLR
jgi:hypothetical protein